MEEGDRLMRQWLFKSEPAAWSWDQQVKDGTDGTDWTGIRNYQARNNMRAMAVGDRGFFYHSNQGKAVVGIVEVIRSVAPDPTADNPTWDCVRIRAVRPFARPVTLEDCKVTPGLEAMALVNNTRLSVQPVSPEEWAIVCRLGGVEP